MASAYCISFSQSETINNDIQAKVYNSRSTELIISRARYVDQLQGFWLGQCIANWTGLITEMDKIEAPFYTDNNWGKPDQPNIWGHYLPNSNKMIDYFFINEGSAWYADDDTDIEYMYQHLLEYHNTTILSAKQIKEGWIKHIYSNEDAPKNENYLWVSNETAYYLMMDGMVPPLTSEPVNNPNYSMIDAQLTTEIFGLFAPGRPDVALKLAYLPIRTTAKFDAEWISNFYVSMHSLASSVNDSLSMNEKVFWLSNKARKELPKNSFSAKMYDFIFTSYKNNSDKNNWEKTRDEVYHRYQKNSSDGFAYCW